MEDSLDDPNSVLPSDPTVDESYTRHSRPVKPRARSGARAAGEERGSATGAANAAGAKGRKAATGTASTKERPTRGRTKADPSVTTDEAGAEPRWLVSTQALPTPRRRRLLHRGDRAH